MLTNGGRGKTTKRKNKCWTAVSQNNGVSNLLTSVQHSKHRLYPNTHLCTSSSALSLFKYIFLALLKLLMRNETASAGNEATLNFYLSSYTSTDSVLEAVNITYLGGNTNTTGALRLARTAIFDTANGDRPDVLNVIVLITDGKPTRELAGLPAEVRHIKDLGTRIVGVGVTQEVSRNLRHHLIWRYKIVFGTVRINTNHAFKCGNNHYGPCFYLVQKF